VLDTVASDADEYVDIAVALGTDKKLQGDVRARTLAAAHKLYG
jgi:predicted O-linked N-acetylglucosamine transferase (SPINDLY family)